VKNAVGGLLSGAKGLLGISSPSTVFAEIGANVIRGYNAGMQAQSAYVGTTMANVLMPAQSVPMPAQASVGPAQAAGPAVHIEHAEFSREVDVDLLMRRAAWAVQTRAA
jgi:hypothetical protein